MGRYFAAIALGVAVSQWCFAGAVPKQNAETSSIVPQKASSGPSTLPPSPSGRTTVIGGTIREVDPVRDQLTLKVFGDKKPMKILFDERTQFYLDGKRAPLHDLKPETHAAVETVLDGTDVFARSIHILTQAPEGECRGQVVSYNPGSGELTVRPALAQTPIELHVPAGTPMVREGQNASPSAGSEAHAAGVPDLVKGTIVRVQFVSDNSGKGIARRIAVLASPGSEFVFSGSITFLDLHSNRLVVADPLSGESYAIEFDPSRFPVSQKLQQGVNVRVTTMFDGTHYVANGITIQ